MSATYFYLQMFMLALMVCAFVYEILIEHTPITTILIEHTLIRRTTVQDGKYATYKVFLPLLHCTPVAFLSTIEIAYILVKILREYSTFQSNYNRVYSELSTLMEFIESTKRFYGILTST